MPEHSAPVTLRSSWFRRLVSTVACVALWLLASPAVPLSARAVSCTISAVGVAFGNYDVFSASPLDSTGVVTYKCTQTRSITIDLSRGSSTTFNPRKMKRSTETLSYNLYLDALRSVIWGDGSSSTSHLSISAPANQSKTATIYGRIPARQDVTFGAYSDTITVTITF